MAKKEGYNYFAFFSNMMACGRRSAEYLHGVLGRYEYERLSCYKEEIHKLEHQADLLKHEMTGHLMKEFLPPIDREDIVRIAHLLDEVCDCTEEAVQLLYMDDIRDCRPDAASFTEIILRECGELMELFAAFPQFKKNASLEAHIVLINTIEEEGDRLYMEAMHRLHTDGTALADQLYWQELYTCLENCCDVCEKIADAVEEVLMKSA